MSYAEMHLWSIVLPTIQIEDHIIWAIVTREMYEHAGLIGHDDGGLVSKLIQVDEAYISAVFKQKEDGGIEIGFRGVPGFDTANVAVALGGGGHKLASGATVHEPLDTLVPRVIEMLKVEVRNGKPVVP
jgi:bifunctional oligoribonuclease and PAP phosphatase NrnA